MTKSELYGASNRTVTRADLSEAVLRTVGLSRAECSSLVEMFLDEVSDTLARGEIVKISSFGNFEVRKKGLRMGRNPKTGEEVPILPRWVMVFKPSSILTRRINGHTAPD